MCYKDKTFCPYESCKLFRSCSRALTKEVKASAKEWWGKDDPPICVYSERPSCFIREAIV